MSETPISSVDPELVEFVRALIKAAGGAAAVAEYFDINRLSVYDWIRKGHVPADRCPGLEKLTEGAFRVEKMRPDVQDWAYLRQTVTTPVAEVANG